MAEDVRQALRDNWPYSGHCPECDHYNSHTVECSLAPHVYRLELIKDLKARMMWYHDRAQEFGRDATFWQGKHAMLRHENNRLRKKLQRMLRDQRGQSAEAD